MEPSSSSSASSPIAPVLCQEDELSDEVLWEAVLKMEEGLPQLNCQDVYNYLNGVDSPILIADSDDDDADFSPPPPMQLSPTALLTGDGVITISSGSDSDSMPGNDTIDGESLSIDSNDELPDEVLWEAVLKMEEGLPQLNCQDVYNYLNGVDSPILIADSDDDDADFSPPPPIHLSPTALLTGDGVITISSGSDNDSMSGNDTMDEESLSIDSDVESN